MITPDPIFAADFYRAGHSQPAQVVFTEIRDGKRVTLETVHVADKREARKIAVERGATPWNF